MIFSELQTALSNRLGLPAAGDALLTSTSLAALINEALGVISTERMWWWLLTDVTFQFNGGVATLPTDLVKIEAVQAYGGLIEPVSRRDLIDSDYVELPSPVGWTTVGNQIRLAPAPAGLIAGRMFYYRTETTLVAGSDLPAMPVAFHGVIIAYAAYLAHTRRQDPVRAQAATLEYQAWLKRMVDDQSPVKGPRRVRIGRDRAPATFPSSTLPAQPSITTGGVIVCTSLTRPTAVDGQLILETDTDRLLEYDATLVAWVPPRGIGYVGPSGSPPATAYDGELWFRTDLRDLVARNTAGASWVAVASPGVPIYTSGTRPASPPDGTVIFETDTRRLMVYSFGLGWQSPAGLVYICTSATRPSLQYDGQTIFETDTRRLMTYQANITTWVPTPGTVLICTSATRPAAVAGRAIYETDTHKLLIYTTATTQWQKPWNLPWGLVGFATSTSGASGITVDVDVAGLSINVAWPANRFIKVTYVVTAQLTASGTIFAKLTDLANVTQNTGLNTVTAAGIATVTTGLFLTSSGPAIAYKGRISTNAAGTLTLYTAGVAHFIIAEDLGPVGLPV